MEGGIVGVPWQVRDERMDTARALLDNH